MNRFFGTITIAGFLVALLCGTATAGKHPHTRVDSANDLTTYYDSVGTSTQSLTETFTWYAI